MELQICSTAVMGSHHQLAAGLQHLAGHRVRTFLGRRANVPEREFSEFSRPTVDRVFNSSRSIGKSFKPIDSGRHFRLLQLGDSIDVQENDVLGHRFRSSPWLPANANGSPVGWRTIECASQ